MVAGLESFKKHFATYSDKYVLIGGTACSLIMDDVGLDFRATKDLDIVLCIEALDAQFVSAFWDFIREGGYSNYQSSTGKAIFYRFSSPKHKGFPAMLELFSRLPEHVFLREKSHLIPIAINESLVSLSAILLNNDYYQFIHQGNQMVNGLPVVATEYLIALKARAWIDIKQRYESGVAVDKRDIRKHRNDILRLSQLVSHEARIQTPQSIQQDIKHFLAGLEQDKQLNLKDLNIKNVNKGQVITLLRKIYGID